MSWTFGDVVDITDLPANHVVLANDTLYMTEGDNEPKNLCAGVGERTYEYIVQGAIYICPLEDFQVDLITAVNKQLKLK